MVATHKQWLGSEHKVDLGGYNQTEGFTKGNPGGWDVLPCYSESQGIYVTATTTWTRESFEVWLWESRNGRGAGPGASGQMKHCVSDKVSTTMHSRLTNQGGLAVAGAH